MATEKTIRGESVAYGSDLDHVAPQPDPINKLDRQRGKIKEHEDDLLQAVKELAGREMYRDATRQGADQDKLWTAAQEFRRAEKAAEAAIATLKHDHREMITLIAKQKAEAGEL